MGTCSDLFLRLLALDHSRRQPWGAYHGVSVAAYLLQHPSLSATSVLRGQWKLATVFVDRGIAAVHALTEALVARNRDGARRPDEGLQVDVDLDRRPASFAVTIADVSVTARFPLPTTRHGSSLGCSPRWMRGRNHTARHPDSRLGSHVH
jgi:hypothetical protein